MLGKGGYGVAPVCVRCIIITLPQQIKTGGGAFYIHDPEYKRTFA